MRKIVALSIMFFSLTLIPPQLYAQARLLNKVKEKAEDKLIDELFKEPSDKKTPESNSSVNNNSSSNSSNSSSNSNTKGGGLSASRPDVIENIDAASGAFGSKKYGEARDAINQAMMAVEMEMGDNVLKSLPTSVNGLETVSDKDNVTSSGSGFVGLTIYRAYIKNDKEVDVTIANNSAMLMAVNMYLSNTYTSSTDQDYKQIKFQNYKGIIEYDESSGYKLSVPFGQTSIFVLEAINFETENEVMDAAAKFSIEKIKQQLGEQ